MKDNKSIAVLPFLNMSSNIEAEYFSDGITEEIINALAKIKELKVTSRTSSFSFKGTTETIAEIGKKLNVSIVLEGSVRLSGNFIRITAQLIEAENDFHFWSETFDRELTNIFSIQDEISLIIADKLREHIGHFELSEHLVDSYTISLDTYKKYLKGRYFLMKLDSSNTMKGISILEEVIEDSPEFPLPYLDINQGYTYMGTMGIISAMEGFMKAQPFLEKAIELNPNLPETQLNLAWISCWQNRNLKQAYIHLNNALSMRPVDNMYLTMSNFLTIEGKLDVAMKYVDKALELAPFGPVNVHYKGFLNYMLGNYETALTYFKRGLGLQPELPFPVVYIGLSHLLLGNQKEGLEYFNKLPSDNTGFLPKLGGTTIAHIYLKNKPEVVKGLSKLESFLTTSSMGEAFYFLILCHAQLNNFEKALEYLQKAIENHVPIVLLLRTDPLAKPLRNLPVFKKCLSDILTLPDQLENKRKYKKSLFTDKELINYKNKLNSLMELNELYLNPELNLRLLAKHMNLPPNHLSQLLNEGFEQNFSDYTNSFRLEYFKTKLSSKTAHQLTILALAYDSGFNSKTVFNTFFKKTMGMNPRDYWKQIKE